MQQWEAIMLHFVTTRHDPQEEGGGSRVLPNFVVLPDLTRSSTVTMGGKVIAVENTEQFSDILAEAGDKLVVVDFTATWCGPCKMIGPIYEELSTKPENANIIFLKVDVDEAGDVSEKCSIRCMPTFQFYKNREMVAEFSGANKKKLVENLEALRT